MRLTITILFSILAIATYDLYPQGDYNKQWDLLKIGGPGIFYSIYLINSIPRKLRMIQIIGIFFLLLLLWFLSFSIGFSTWGIGVIFIGAANALIVEKIIFNSKKIIGENGMKYLIVGGLSGLFGYLGFLLTPDILTFGGKMIWIILFWQLGISTLIKKQKHKEIKHELE